MQTDHTTSPLEGARDIIEHTGVNLFLTGKAGTGKTTFLHSLSESTAKRHVVLAPTGVAAINAGGVTIHSFFQLSFAPFLPGRGYASTDNERERYQRFSRDKLRLIRTLDLIIIDEISMVRPDVLDAMDSVLRRLRNPLKPFGGVQLLLIGDLRQLAPVAQDDEWQYLKDYYASPYFFESHALKEAGFLMVELTKVFRQNDEAFIDILNRIRDNRADQETLQRLNRRANQALIEGDESQYIRLTTHNYRANSINQSRLAALQTPPLTFTAKISGDFPEGAYPADAALTLKEGAEVMFIKNDISGNHEYYNGMLGRIVSLTTESVVVQPRDGGKNIKVGCAVWERMKYTLTPSGEIKETPEGTFQQIPLRLAWAITIHKSQGLTFDKAIVDAAHSFAPGQTYVALSRCRSLDGLVLDSPLPASAIMTDQAVSNFISLHPRVEGSDQELDTFKESYYAQMLYELFDFRQIDDATDAWTRATASTLSRDFPKFLDEASQITRTFHIEVTDVVARLHSVFRKGLPYRSDPEVADTINTKIRNGAAYFAKKLKPLEDIVKSTPLNIDNQRLKRRVQDTSVALCEAIAAKMRLLDHHTTHEFNPGDYLKAKTGAILASTASQASVTHFLSGGRRPAGSPAANYQSGSSRNDVKNPELYQALVDWRTQAADGRPAFVVCYNRTLMEIAAAMPATMTDLLAINGIGKRKCEEFGEAILEVVSRFRD